MIQLQTPMGAESRPVDFAQLREFPELAPASFQHPFDLQAIDGIRKIPFFSTMVKKLSSALPERQMRLMLMSSCIRLSRSQGRSLYEKFEKAASILDLPRLPEVYLSSSLQFNAVSHGIDNYRIILFAPLVDALTEEELLAVIGHELGHVKCGHELYMTMVYLLRTFGQGFLSNVLPLGIGMGVSAGLQLAVLHWYRMAELSCDRAALLVVQDSTVVARMLSKLAGGSRRVLPEINLEGILQQVDKYDDADDNLVDKVMKVTMMLNETHPFPLVRVKEIVGWAESDEYQKLLSGVREGVATAVIPGVMCPECREPVSITAPFCWNCSLRLRDVVRVCASCRAPTEPDWTVCERCGNDLVLTSR